MSAAQPTVFGHDGAIEGEADTRMSSQDGPVADAAPQPALRREQFTFTGTWREYLGIWIVNILLTILTLGIYSAWAKVRRNRYFYGNTRLAGGSFDYHARPVQILIGRIIVVALLIAYNLAANFVPIIGGVLGVVFLFAIPWFVMRGLRFSARVTSFRNVRFDFTGGYGGAFLAYVLGGLLTWGSLGVLAPIASQWMWRYTLDNLRYGDRPIDCDPRLEKLYGQFVMPLITFIIGLVVIIVLGVSMFSFASGIGFDFEDFSSDFALVGILAAVYAAFIPFFLLYVLVGLLYRAGTRNVALNETVIDGRHLLASNIGRWRYAWIAISNFFATLFTLGMARPWAAVRMANYLATVTALYSAGSLDEYLSTVKQPEGVVGAEFMDVEGLDFGF
ncbi:MAG: YjgN family protein [Rhizobiaceae bacterium]